MHTEGVQAPPTVETVCPRLTQLLAGGNVIGMQLCIRIKLEIIPYILQKNKEKNRGNTNQGT